MENIKIECRNCNTYFKIYKKNYKYKCPKCKFEENLVVIHKEGINKYEKK